MASTVAAVDAAAETGLVQTGSTVVPASFHFENTNADYAFLVHSQNTLGNTLPPAIDNKSLARQRRRRTSPEDQAILEEEYKHNDKPDKAARRAIVGRVSGMGEKEVQIWFQNRRQNNRRRSRQLEPHDRSAQTSSQDPMRARSSTPPSAAETNKQWESQPGNVAAETMDVAPIAEAGPMPERELAEGLLTTQLIAGVTTAKDEVEALLEVSYTSAADKDGSKASTVPLQDKPKPARSLKRTSSGVRLSLNSEGSALILQEDESSPSPPPANLTTTMVPDAESCRSSLDFYSNQSHLHNSTPPLRRGPSGRSRDSRAWSFWCDADSPTELSLKAAQEETGSAAAAISLMRSNSGNSKRTILGPMSSGGFDRSKSSHPAKRPRPAFARASTSIARFDGSSDRRDGFQLFDELAEKRRPVKKPSKNALRGLVQSPSAESDKENADPDAFNGVLERPRLDERFSAAHSRTKANASRPKLVKSQTAPNGRGRTSIDQRKSAMREAQDKENGSPEEDEEVADFMSNGRGRLVGMKTKQPMGATAASEEDLNCVRGLLSLSQAGSSS